MTDIIAKWIIDNHGGIIRVSVRSIATISLSETWNVNIYGPLKKEKSEGYKYGVSIFNGRTFIENIKIDLNDPRSFDKISELLKFAGNDIRKWKWIYSIIPGKYFYLR